MKAESAGMQEAGGGDVPGAEDGADDVFFCVAATSRSNKKKISYFHTNAVGEDAEAESALAALCLDHAPEHHRWHHHTVAGARSFAFLLAADGRTYFGAADPSPGGAEMVRFLERVRDACDSAPRLRLRDDAVAPVARRFAQALRAATAVESSTSTAAGAALPGASPRAREPSTPLVPVCADGAGVEKDEEPQLVGARLRAVQPEESAWWRQAVVVIGVDVVVCLVLFAVWMGVCKGFRCLTR
uniref:Longin domain-containing protein n=1 Tax=Arundo donax TaxID=35708 RepID=A0A0A9GB15_ARUDO